MGFIGDLVDNITGGEQSSDAAKEAGKIDAAAAVQAADFSEDMEWKARTAEAGGEVQARNYLMQQNEVDRQGSSNAKRRVMGLYGLNGGTGSQQQLINQAEESPLYGAITGTRKAGEDAIMRNASATGGLRSGNVQSNVYDYNQRLDERALNESYNQQLQGLEGIAGWQTNEDNIADAMLRPGETTAQALRDVGRYRAQGAVDEAGALSGSKIAAANAVQAGRGGLIDNAASVAGAKWSDRRLKGSVKLLDKINGINIYEWVWNTAANALGLTGRDVGVMADEIEQTHPAAVGTREGFKTVNYSMLGI